MSSPSTADDCNEYICSNEKDEKQLKQVMSRQIGNLHNEEWYAELFKERPLNAIDLGRSTWPLLHKFTLKYPMNPNEEE